MKKQNQKIRNATASKSNNIVFKSQLEKLIYNTLIQEGFSPQYEPKTFLLWEGFTPITPFYDKETDSQVKKRGGKPPRLLTLKSDKIVGIRYTPDFYLKYNDLDVWIEAKGIENDVFYIKKKLFRKHLDNLFKATSQQSIFFEIYTKAQLLQAIQIFKEYENSHRKNQ